MNIKTEIPLSLDNGQVYVNLMIRKWKKILYITVLAMTAVLSGCSGNTETSTNSEQFSGISSKTEESNMNSEMTA